MRPALAKRFYRHWTLKSWREVTFFSFTGLDILKQSIEAFKKSLAHYEGGVLTGETSENVSESDVLFASKILCGNRMC